MGVLSLSLSFLRFPVIYQTRAGALFRKSSTRSFKMTGSRASISSQATTLALSPVDEGDAVAAQRISQREPYEKEEIIKPREEWELSLMESSERKRVETKEFSKGLTLSTMCPSVLRRSWLVADSSFYEIIGVCYRNTISEFSLNMRERKKSL